MAEGSGRSPVPDASRVPLGTRAFVLTVSDSVAGGSRRDESGEALVGRLERLGFTVERGVSADVQDLIAVALRSALDQHALIVTTGGTGLTPRDVTPQATASVLEYEVPGLAEAMRAAGRAKTPMADLSRGLVGVARGRLVANLPGSPRAALESLAALEPTLRHALETLAGPFDHGATSAARPDLPDPELPEPELGGLGDPRRDTDMTARGIATDPSMPGAAASEPPLGPDDPLPPEPAPGDTSDPWRDLPPSRYDPG